jgi:hypothetical protein
MLKLLGIVAVALGILVLLVATYHSVQNEYFAWVPLLLGFTAVLSGFVSLKKAREQA